jgi:RimJ/RimL family protein N-acetyltransferase
MTLAVETSRLNLTIIGEHSVKDVFDTLNYRETAEMISFLTWPMTLEQAEGWCKIAIEGIPKGKYLYIAHEKEKGRPVGCICLVEEQDPKRGEIGYWVANPWQGKGIASEMIQAMIDLGFGKLGFSTIVAKIAAHNPSSLGAVKKFGFQPNGEEIKKTAKGTDLKLTVYELKQDIVP